jgi:MinD-like ATPase involved in chromosome partitioning or flagellar assembly
VGRLRAPVIAPGDRSPVPRLRRLRGAATGARAPRTWAFASGSGGVGRSTLAVTLGARLVRRGRTTCLVDGDWTGPTLGTLLEVSTPRASWSGGDAFQSLATAVHDELELVPGPGPTATDPSRRDASRLWENIGALSHDEVLVDLPGGAHDAALDVWLASDFPLLVAVPERLPLEATARLLGRVFARLARPWLARRLGAVRADEVLDRAWVECGGRTGTWMRATARLAGLSVDDLAAHVGGRSLYLVMNRVRRGDDIDVGHALVTAAGHGLGIDLRFRAALPWDEDAWIRARRRSVGAGAAAGDVLGTELDETLQRMDDGVDLPTRGGWRADLSALAKLAQEGAGSGTPPGGAPWR